LPFFETLLQDLRYGARNLRKSPGFTAVAVITLALGIGANTAIFSIINAVLLRPLPYKDQDRLVQLWETEAAPGTYPFAGPDYLDWEKQTKTLEATSVYTWPMGVNASNNGEAQSLTLIQAETNLFSVLGVDPIVGRTFAPDESQPGKDHVVVVTYGVWQRFFGGRKDVIGQKLELDAEPYSVIGIMPRWFKFSRGEVFIPKDMSAKGMHERGSHWLLAIGRLKPGQTVASAQAELSTIAKNLERQYPDSNDKIGATVISLKEQYTGDNRQELFILLGAVALVLLVACANVANLLLARATGRLREIALRAVLGASRWRIVRQLLTESILLSITGAVVGLGAAWWFVSLVQNAKTLPIPRANPIQVDVTVLLFTIFVSVFVGVLFGLAPALQASNLDLGEELKSTAQAVLSPSGWNRWFRDGLVVGEIAVSLTLLAGAGLLLRSFYNLRNAPTGFDGSHVVTFSTLLPQGKYDDLTSRRRFFDRLLEGIHSMPGVDTAAIASEIPLEGGTNGYIKVDGDTDPAHRQMLVEQNYVTPDYFAALGIPFFSGSNFSPTDMDREAEAEQKVEELFKQNPNLKNLPPDLTSIAIINRVMAKTFWAGQDPVGKTYRNGGRTFRIIGVVGDVTVGSVRGKPMPEAYYPFTRALVGPIAFGHLLIKTHNDPTAILPSARARLRTLDSSLALFNPRTMPDVVADSMQDETLQTWLLGSFAGLTLLLAAVGLYSVLSYLVLQRSREIGIRMALGAKRTDVLRMVMRQAGTLTVLGIGLGLLGALSGARVIQRMCFGLTARDPLTFAGVVVLLAGVALLASYVPVRRAMRVDPMVALRYE
jgi:putative ABC transport system permease protein